MTSLTTTANDASADQSKDLTGQFVYFQGIHPHSIHASLEGTLLLVAKDGAYVSGYIVNQYMDEDHEGFELVLGGKTSFGKVMDGAIEGINEGLSSPTFTLLTRKEIGAAFPNSKMFGDYCAITCEDSIETVEAMLKLAKITPPIDVMMINSDFSIRRSVLKTLINEGLARVCLANPNVVFGKEKISPAQQQEFNV